MKASFKTLTLLALAMLLTFTSVFAQSTETLQVDITKLSQNELLVYQQMKQKQVESAKTLSMSNLSPENIDKYGQMAKAFGSAVKEGLGAITHNVDEFAQTGAGKMTIALIAWKVMGNDAVHLVEKTVQYGIGLPLLFFGTLFFVYLIRRNCTSRPALVSKTKLFGVITIKSEYKGNMPAVHEEVIWAYGIFYAIFVGICSLILFVN